jgi:hypothetical protein
LNGEYLDRVCVYERPPVIDYNKKHIRKS